MSKKKMRNMELKLIILEERSHEEIWMQNLTLPKGDYRENRREIIINKFSKTTIDEK